MPRKTFALLLSLFVIVVLLIFLSIKMQQGNKLPQPVTQMQPTSQSPSASPTISPEAHTVLSMIFNNGSISTGNDGTVSIQIASGDNKIVAAQLDIVFDPTMIGNVDITPGNSESLQTNDKSFLPNPTVFLKKIDQTKGTISFVLAIPPTETAIAGNGRLATVYFKALKVGTTYIRFTPRTQVTAQGISESVLSKTIDGIIKIDSGVNYNKGSQTQY